MDYKINRRRRQAKFFSRRYSERGSFMDKPGEARVHAFGPNRFFYTTTNNHPATKNATPGQRVSIELGDGEVMQARIMKVLRMGSNTKLVLRLISNERFNKEGIRVPAGNVTKEAIEKRLITLEKLADKKLSK